VKAGGAPPRGENGSGGGAGGTVELWALRGFGGAVLARGATGGFRRSNYGPGGGGGGGRVLFAAPPAQDAGAVVVDTRAGDPGTCMRGAACAAGPVLITSGVVEAGDLALLRDGKL
jgi:hypothetical protein